MRFCSVQKVIAALTPRRRDNLPICIDFDGVLVENSWPDNHDAELIPEGVELVRQVALATNKPIIIYTSRHSSDESYIWQKLEEAGLTHLVESVETDKPVASMYIDDRAFNPLEPEGERLAFDEVLDEIRELHRVKQHDYGREDDPFANVRASEEWGIPAWVGALVRLNDKVRRLQKAARGDKLWNETVEDSLKDIMVYAGIALLLYRETYHDG
jgi:hypothetical protein